MPWKYFEIPLSDGLFIVVDVTRNGGRVTAFVVRLMYDSPTGLWNVTRYDGAHGVPHRDQMGISGRLVAKTWMPGVDFESALEYGISDLKANHEIYLEVWKEN